MTDLALIERITRSLAFMLRHQPETFDLELDPYGFADLEDVVQALNERLGEPVEEEDVREAVSGGDRPRYEIQDDRIRALYGHSIPVDPGPSSKPPEFLYVAIPAQEVERARRFGLRGGRRRFLHLATTREDAAESGRRASREYTVLLIHALDAWEEGISFYDRHSLWLAEEVPTNLIEVEGSYSDGTDPLPRHSEAGRGPARERERHRGHERHRDGGGFEGGRRRGGRGRGRGRRDERDGRGFSERREPEAGHAGAPEAEHRDAPEARERDFREPEVRRDERPQRDPQGAGGRGRERSGGGGGRFRDEGRPRHEGRGNGRGEDRRDGPMDPRRGERQGERERQGPRHEERREERREERTGGRREERHGEREPERRGPPERREPAFGAASREPGSGGGRSGFGAGLEGREDIRPREERHAPSVRPSAPPPRREPQEEKRVEDDRPTFGAGL